MFRFFNETKPGRRDTTSMLEAAMDRAETLLNKDAKKGLHYFKLAEQYYEQLDPETPGYLEIEYRLGAIFVDYIKKQADII